MRTAHELPLAPLHRRLAAMVVNAGVGVVGVAAVGATAVVAVHIGKRFPGRLRVSMPTKNTMSAMTVVGSVLARNWRSPGAKVMGIRKVDARTGGPISVRTALVQALVTELWGALLNRVFGPYEQPRLADVQAKLQSAQPELRDLQRKHADDEEALQRAQMEFYKRHKISPLGACLPLLPKMLAGQVPRLFSPRHQNLPDWIAGVAVVTEPGARRGRARN